MERMPLVMQYEVQSQTRKQLKQEAVRSISSSLAELSMAHQVPL